MKLQLLDLFESNDAIMADKGFGIRESSAKRREEHSSLLGVQSKHRHQL